MLAVPFSVVGAIWDLWLLDYHISIAVWVGMIADGLSDFHETHKYRTDPNNKDTAGKGIPDGDWQQRREFTYSVRAVIRVMPPYNLKALNDDYQDVRVRKENKEFIELETVIYPFNSNAGAIKDNPNWKKDYAGMKEYLNPGITTNWDDQMRRDLLHELSRDGIHPDQLTDRQVIEQVSHWLFNRSKYHNRAAPDAAYTPKSTSPLLKDPSNCWPWMKPWTGWRRSVPRLRNWLNFATLLRSAMRRRLQSWAFLRAKPIKFGPMPAPGYVRRSVATNRASALAQPGRNLLEISCAVWRPTSHWCLGKEALIAGNH
jgi:hypothetical protein